MASEMSQIRSVSHENPAPTWAEMLGTVVRKKELRPELQESDGLIWVDTSDDTDVCPVRQFVYGTSGKMELIPSVVNTYRIIRSVLEQEGISNNSLALRFLSPLSERADGKSFLDVLIDPRIPHEEKSNILNLRLSAELGGMAWAGIDVIDPRRILG